MNSTVDYKCSRPEEHMPHCIAAMSGLRSLAVKASGFEKLLKPDEWAVLGLGSASALFSDIISAALALKELEVFKLTIVASGKIRGVEFSFSRDKDRSWILERTSCGNKTRYRCSDACEDTMEKVVFHGASAEECSAMIKLISRKAVPVCLK